MKKLVVFAFLVSFVCCVSGSGSTSYNDSVTGGKQILTIVFSIGDYSEEAAMNHLDSRCMIQWITDDGSPLSASFSLQDVTNSEAVASGNVFGISFQVTA